MSNQTSFQPSLCIDLKKNRIRIHRRTLQLIGNPEYIQLLVNPSDSKIAIRRSGREDYLAHKVHMDAVDCIELYSSILIENLMTVNNGLSWNRSYRLYGSIDALSEMALFSMREPVPINDDGGKQCMN
ncbi:MAG: hypothetical protein LUF35_08385 [Lachnospiraceae bacterium]|nr:hypothetical protein [Lachnospiraceae bacterium]